MLSNDKQGQTLISACGLAIKAVTPKKRKGEQNSDPPLKWKQIGGNMYWRSKLSCEGAAFTDTVWLSNMKTTE